MDRSSWSRIAAATGIDFVVLIVIGAIVAEVKNFERPGDLALGASNEVWGSVAIMLGVAAIALFWFSSTLAGRLRQLEGGSGRLAAAVNGSGAILSGAIALAVTVGYAARNTGSAELGYLMTSILDGPFLMFVAAVYVGAAGLVGLRSAGLPIQSLRLAQLSLPLAAAYIGGAGLLLFKQYAWIDETAYITFLVWVGALSIIGIQRWGAMDEPVGRATASRPAPAPALPPAEVAEETTPAPKPAPKRKPAARKRSTARKSTTRKSTARKSTARKPAARKNTRKR